MQERARERRQIGAEGPGGGLFEAPPGAGGTVEVAHGTYREALPVADSTVAAVRRRFADRFDIHPEATALVDGNRVDDTTVLRAGQQLTFVRQSGVKGRA